MTAGPSSELRRGSGPGHRTRILLIDRDPATITALHAIFRSQEWEVISARSGAEGLQKARQDGSDAVVAEMHLADMKAPDFCRALRERAETANIPVIVLSASSGVAERVACLRAGAADYLVKPPDAQELLARVRAALDLRHEKSAFVIAVCSGKGGVGTSMVAVNLAVALRRITRASVVLIDAGAHMGAADVMLNLQARSGVEHLLLQLEELEESDFEAILTPHASGLQALLLQQQGYDGNAEELRRILLALRRMRDFVVVDLGSSFEQGTATALELADRALVVVTPEITALRGARLFLQWAEQMGTPLDRIVPVLNRFPQRGGLQRRVVENALGARAQAVIADDVKLVTYGVNRGVALSQSHRRSKVARQIAGLAQELAKAAQWM